MKIFNFFIQFTIIFTIYTSFLLFTFNFFIPVNTSFIKNKLSVFYIKPKISRVSRNLYMRAAIIASEDQRFYHHWGLDLDELKKVLSSKKGKRRGASTITQQLSKNLFLYKKRSYLRKMTEVYYSLLMEFIIPKNRILDIYTSVVETGNGIYGFENAAIKYFNKNVNDLSKKEVAFLVSLLPNPTKYYKIKNSTFIKRRTDRIVNRMKYILESENKNLADN